MNPLDDLSRYGNVIPHEHLPALGRDLKRIPDFSWVLSSPHPSEKYLQGDILSDFPTVFLDPTGAPRQRRFTVMVLNNTCDLLEGRMDFITAAPIVDFNSFILSEKKRRTPVSVESFAHAIRKNDKTELLYLPPFDTFPQGGLVFLHLMCSISSKLYQDALRNGNRIASFSQTGFYFLLMKLTIHLTRMESNEVLRQGSQ